MPLTTTNTSKCILFTACCFDPRLKLGTGCMLVLPAEEMATLKTCHFEKLSFETKDFEQITASRLELKTTIWALELFKTDAKALKLTVCNNFRATKDLLQRREKLELTNYAGFRPATTITNAVLFQQFFKLNDRLHFDVLWMGEPAEDAKKTTPLQPLFKEVVKRADQALKSQLKAQNPVADKWF